jgi:peroxiredoxin Q/BCP
VTIPETGKPAPPFTAKTDTGATVRLADFRGRWVALFFYPVQVSA